MLQTWRPYRLGGVRSSCSCMYAQQASFRDHSVTSCRSRMPCDRCIDSIGFYQGGRRRLSRLRLRTLYCPGIVVDSVGNNPRNSELFAHWRPPYSQPSICQHGHCVHCKAVVPWDHVSHGKYVFSILFIHHARQRYRQLVLPLSSPSAQEDRWKEAPLLK